METAIVSIICVALIAFGGMTMSRGFMTSVDNSARGMDTAGQRNETIMRTELTPSSTSFPSGNTLDIILENTGQTKLADFDKWDVIIQYYDDTNNYHVVWLPYTDEALGDNEWQVSWIRYNGAPEVFEPGILNPKEEIKIRAQLKPAPGPGTTNLAVVATPNGITASTYFLP
jgi:flagellar protein FlaF